MCMYQQNQFDQAFSKGSAKAKGSDLTTQVLAQSGAAPTKTYCNGHITLMLNGEKREYGKPAALSPSAVHWLQVRAGL
jgi:hypothetical protein